MNPVTVLIGVAAIGFGVYTLYLRSTDPANFGKLTAMKEKFGESTGSLIHLVAYSIVPIVVGVVFLLMGLRGGSLF